MLGFLIVINLLMIALLVLAAIVGSIACKIDCSDKFNCSKIFSIIYHICDGIVTIMCVLYLLEVFVLVSAILFEVARESIYG